MKKIELTRGQFALVDDEDFEWLNQWKWHARWESGSRSYTAARRTGKRPNREHVLMHRLIMSTPNEEECDHINHNSLDNRKHNLRNCTHAQNSRNRRIRRNNTSGYQGVSWNGQVKKWQSRIKYNGQSIYLGIFVDPIDAARAYNEKAQELFGEFVVLNPLPVGESYD